MDSRLSELQAALKSSRHEIRGMQLARDDVECLRDGAKLKVPSTVINAVGALLQILGKGDSPGDFAVFSTWLSPLISRKVPQGTIYGTIASQIAHACDDDPPHWVLGWVDRSASELHIFDSVPELQSYMWAEPVLVELAETVFTTLGQLSMNLEPWPVFKHSPPELQRQMNGYACGFFVIHAMCVVGNGQPISAVINDATEKIRNDTLDTILANLSLLRPAVPSNDVEMTAPKENPPNRDNIPIILTTIAVSVPSEVAEFETNLDLPSKRRLEEVDPQPQTKKKTKSTGKMKLTQGEERATLLSANPHISHVEPHRVRCAACSNWVKLHATREFKVDNWNQHEIKCPAITGKRTVRTVIKQTATTVAKGSSSIATYFGVAAKSDSTSSTHQIHDAYESDSESKLKKGEITYTSQLLNSMPSIRTFFSPGPIKNPPPKPVIVKEPKSCTHLSGGKYIEYIDRTETRSMGGVSPSLRARVVRQVLLYKKFEPLKNQARTAEATRWIEVSIPAQGNDCLVSLDWTDAEHVKLDAGLKGFARWEVDFGKKTVRSTRCEGLTTNENDICDACAKVAKDDSLVHAINRKNREAKLPLEEQHQIQLDRAKYSNKRFHDFEGRKLDLLLKDPITFKALKTLQQGQTTECFLQLYEATLNGKLKDYETVKELCSVVAEVIKRQENNTMSGIRYSPHYLNFAILMRSYGGNSARQFGILSGEIPLPSTRHLRTLVAKSEDALHNPYLIFENMARVKRLVDSIHYSGPVGVAGDCTKVRKRLAYSNDFGGHIIGSVWALEDCIAEDPDDIKRVIEEITEAKAEATQVCAILIKIPLPHIPPQVVALLPTNGKDDGPKIVEQQLKLLAMAAQLSLPVVCFAADGAASELAAQKLMDSQKTSFPPITYDYSLYGIHLTAPVMKTGPVVSGQDPGHAKKTAPNQPQHGTKTEDLGEDVVVNQTLVDLKDTGESGLLESDVNNVDKQDDGPARHLFHVKALQACTTGEGDQTKIREGFSGLFVYLFVLGVMFDAWLNRTMTVENRVLAVLRARFFLHIWRAYIVHMSKRFPDLYSTTRSFISVQSFHIFNRLCDSLLLLVIIYARRYPNQPFCPWLLGTEFVEHFFGIARMMLPNFTWAEFIKLVQYLMVRQRILLSGSFKEKYDRKARVGYVLDFDATPLTSEDRKLAEVRMTDAGMNSLVELAFREASLICTQILHIPAPRPTIQRPLVLTPLGVPPPKAQHSDDSDSDDDDTGDEPEEEDTSEPFCRPNTSEESRMIALAAHDAARYSALCDDYEDAVKELEALPLPAPVVFGPLPPPIAVASPVTSAQPVRIARAAESQGDGTEPERMTIQEAANLTRVLQQQNTVIQESQPRKYREWRWKGIAAVVQRHVDAAALPNIIVKNVHPLNPLAIGHWTLMWSGERFYIGEIQEILKKGANSRYGSISSATSVSGLSFLSLRVYLPLVAGGNRSDSDSDEDQEATGGSTVPLFSCNYKGRRICLSTHAKIDHLIFNLGPNIFEHANAGIQHRKLKSRAAFCWTSLTTPGPVSTEVKTLTLKIPKPGTTRS
ncbi:hypothetical protein C8R44DRAFT_992225 [Mycena epipterygia]|nr:hypothetical protein C8R44DRAFT_992225 [Mycena epipterygia]